MRIDALDCFWRETFGADVNARLIVVVVVYLTNNVFWRKVAVRGK
jgi:hypothetical protein